MGFSSDISNGTRRALAFVVASAALVAGLAVPLASPAIGALPTISTVAGGGSGEGPALSFAQQPQSLALRGSTLYVADIKGLVVRALDLETGIQRVVAGNGTIGSSGDGGPARDAQIYPGGIAVSATGNLYIADTPNHRVRMVDAGGTIRTVVGDGVGVFSGDGGPAGAARTQSPSDLAFDAAGNLYIAESGNWRIRKVTPAGVISTVAGNGTRGETGDGGPATAASLEPPWAIAVDRNGNVYVGGLNRVRKISTTGIITTFAGNGTGGKLGDGGPATAAQMDGPVGLATDAAGNLYVSDYWNVRRVDTSGIITSVVGKRLPFGTSFSGDGGPAVDAYLSMPRGIVVGPDGSFYVADTGNGRARAVDPDGIIDTIAGNGHLAWGGDGGPATEAQLGDPRTIATDRGGSLYVLDAYVRRVDPTGTIDAFAGDPSNLGNQFAGDGGPATEAWLSGPTDLGTDRPGNVYIAEALGNRIRKVDSLGVITTVAGSGPAPAEGGFSGDGGPATSAELWWPTGVAVDRFGNLFIADSNNHRIRKVDPEGTITTIAGTGAAGFSGDGGPATDAQLHMPSRVEVDPFGNVFFLDSVWQRVRRIDAAGTITTVAAGQHFTGLALDGAGKVFVGWASFADQFDSSTWRMHVGRVEPSGALTPIAGGAPGYAGDGGPAREARFYYAYDIAFDAAGQLYVADGLNRRVRRITEAGAPASVGDAAFTFIVQAYLDLLGREPTAVEISIWGPLLMQGIPPEWVGGVLVTTVEFRLLASIALYQTWLGRLPTLAEANALADRLAKGTTIEQAWAELAGSEESWARVGRDPGAYVDALYRIGFGHEPEANGKAFWVEQLRRGYSRTTAALAFAYNPAGSTRIIELTYSRFLDREPDKAGMDFWVQQLQSGLRSEYVLAFFVGSQEYRSRVEANVQP